MLLRTLASILVGGILVTSGWAAPSTSLGLAESGKSFKINRSSEVVNGRADTLTKILDGDRVEAAEKPVRVQTAAGNTVMVQGQSSAEFVSPDSLNVVAGDVLVAIAPDSNMNVLIDDLVVSPLKSDGAATSQHLVAVKRLNEGRVVISGFNHPLNVAAKGANGQLAVIGDKDTIELAKTEKGWVVVQADEPAGETEPEEPVDGESEDEEERKGAFWWFTTPVGLLAGVGVLVAGGLLVGDALGGDDDDKEDDSRGPTSQITGGPGDGGSEESSALTFSFF